MSNPRTPIDDLKLQGSSNLRRAIKREQQDADAPPPTPELKTELEQLDALIAQAMRCCRHGSTVRGKRNPAFANLQSLMKCRDLLTKGKPRKKSTADILAEADKLLGIN